MLVEVEQACGFRAFLAMGRKAMPSILDIKCRFQALRTGFHGILLEIMNKFRRSDFEKNP